MGKSESRKRKMLLILPYDNTYYFKGYFKRSVSYAPLTLTTLAALVPRELDFQIEIIDEGVEEFNPKHDFYDIVGITCVASSAPRAYEISKYFRKKGSIVVFGGAHPTLNPEEVSQQCDIVVCGHAERIWPELLKDICEGKTTQKIYKSTPEKYVSSPQARRDLLPSGKYLDVPTVIASRGCRNNCSFCSVNRIWNNSPCSRPVNEVIEEIKRLDSNRILMLDPNIIADRDYACEFFEKLIPLKKKWGGLATINLADDSTMFDLAARSGCIGILVGFESVLQQAMDECNKMSFTTSKYREQIRTFHKANISILGCFVLGFDCEDEHVFDQTVEFVDKIGIDIPRFSVLTPFPGTPLYRDYRKQGRILTDDLRFYDTEHVVFAPAGMSPQRLQQGLHEVWRKTYTHKKVLRRAITSPANKLFAFAINYGFRYYADRIVKRKQTLPYFQ